ncbi:MAG: hypothetical protein U1C97_02880, partial [Candidatus Gracilibacteria bacterium]|nr:hypothetical protein [Candidatus Gracilibacteria bacterium]
MNTFESQIEQAIQRLPERRLSWMADWRIKRRLKRSAEALNSSPTFRSFWYSLAMVPVAMALLLVSAGTYAFQSSAVVRGDFLYPVKTRVEAVFYPVVGDSEERVAYHLWLSERRYAEVGEILRRKSLQQKKVAFIPAARAAESEEDELDRLLRETLGEAQKNMGEALQSMKEIKQPERLNVVKAQVQETLNKQKKVIQAAAPVLKAVKVQAVEVVSDESLKKAEAVQPVSVPYEMELTVVPAEVPQPKPASDLEELVSAQIAEQELLLQQIVSEVEVAEVMRLEVEAAEAEVAALLQEEVMVQDDVVEERTSVPVIAARSSQVPVPEDERGAELSLLERHDFSVGSERALLEAQGEIASGQVSTFEELLSEPAS